MSVTLADGRTFEWLNLRACPDGGVDVVGWKEAPASSVLAGYMLKHFIDGFDTEAEAKAAYPQATNYTSKWTEPQVSLDHLPGEDDGPDDWDD